MNARNVPRPLVQRMANPGHSTRFHVPQQHPVSHQSTANVSVNSQQGRQPQWMQLLIQLQSEVQTLKATVIDQGTRLEEAEAQIEALTSAERKKTVLTAAFSFQLLSRETAKKTLAVKINQPNGLPHIKIVKIGNLIYSTVALSGATAVLSARRFAKIVLEELIPKHEWIHYTTRLNPRYGHESVPPSFVSDVAEFMVEGFVGPNPESVQQQDLRSDIRACLVLQLEASIKSLLDNSRARREGPVKSAKRQRVEDGNQETTTEPAQNPDDEPSSFEKNIGNSSITEDMGNSSNTQDGSVQNEGAFTGENEPEFEQMDDDGEYEEGRESSPFFIDPVPKDYLYTGENYMDDLDTYSIENSRVTPTIAKSSTPMTSHSSYYDLPKPAYDAPPPMMPVQMQRPLLPSSPQDFSTSVPINVATYDLPAPISTPPIPTSPKNVGTESGKKSKPNPKKAPITSAAASTSALTPSGSVAPKSTPRRGRPSRRGKS